MKPGIYNISNKEYHESDGLSRSAISLLLKSPLHYWDKYINPDKEPENSNCYMFGSLVHKLLLEPDTFENEFVIWPEDIDRRTKQGREVWQKLMSDAPGKILVKVDDIERAKSIVNAVKAQTSIETFITHGQIEKSIFWHDKETNVLCKSRPDIFLNNLIVDFKTAESASPRDFKRCIYKFNYHIQAAMALDAASSLNQTVHSNFILIVSEKEAPYATAVYTLTDDVIEKGRAEYKKALKIYCECKEKDTWPSYNGYLGDILEIDLYENAA